MSDSLQNALNCNILAVASVNARYFDRCWQWIPGPCCSCRKCCLWSCNIVALLKCFDNGKLQVNWLHQDMQSGKREIVTNLI